MALTAGFGSGKTLVLQQTASEIAAYTIAVTDINAAGFTIDAIIVDTITAAGTGTLTIDLDGNSVLISGAASTAVQAAGTVVLPLNATFANLSATSGNLVINTLVAPTLSRLTLVLSQASDRSITVS